MSIAIFREKISVIHKWKEKRKKKKIEVIMKHTKIQKLYNKESILLSQVVNYLSSCDSNTLSINR